MTTTQPDYIPMKDITRRFLKNFTTNMDGVVKKTNGSTKSWRAPI